MKLKCLIDSKTELADLEISGITCDSRQVKPGYLFVCICGAVMDGHDFAHKAIEQGAAVVITQRDMGIRNQIIVDDTHAAYASLCARWFGDPAKSLTLIGVTGTNGKTSVTYMMKKILEKAGHKVGLIGTIQNMIGEEIIAAHNTTPNAYELNSLFALMKAKGCTHVIMEVSSHALDQCRVYKLDFEVAMFTNLTQDHLDYHVTMENYLSAKKKLFRMCKKAVVNADDPYVSRLTQGLTCECVTYSVEKKADYRAVDISYLPAKVSYTLKCDAGKTDISVMTGGRFTVYNSMCAAAGAAQLGIPLSVTAQALGELCGVKGRAEPVPTGRDFTVIIDYAHTPDGLKNILMTFRECRKNRLVVLFGCGGDRDKTKRPLMGEIAAQYADYAIVTSDNPRTEDPSAIIRDILEGMKNTKTPYRVIENRVEAIRYAVSVAEKDDIIVLAGKGHETYQILGTGTIHLDEREVVADALKEREEKDD